MKTIFFKISDKQAEEIKALMDEEGYTSKAEFFRFLVKFFKYGKREKEDHSSLEKTTKELEKVLIELDEKGYFDNLPSLEEQLSDI